MNKDVKIARYTNAWIHVVTLPSLICCKYAIDACLMRAYMSDGKQMCNVYHICRVLSHGKQRAGYI